MLRQRRSELELARQQLADTVLVVAARRRGQRAPGVRRRVPRGRGAGGDASCAWTRCACGCEVPERDGGARARRPDRARHRRRRRRALRGHAWRASRRRSPSRTARCSVEAEMPNTAAPPARARSPAEIVVQAADQRSVIVPATAIVTFAGIEKVITVEDGKARGARVHHRPPRGRPRSRSSTGLTAGEPVVVEPGNLSRRPGRDRSPKLEASMQKLAEICIRRPVFAAMIVLALVVVGAASYFRLGVDRFPAVDLPTVIGAHDAARRLARGGRDGGHRRRSRRPSTPSRASRELRSISGQRQRRS